MTFKEIEQDIKSGNIDTAEEKLKAWHRQLDELRANLSSRGVLFDTAFGSVVGLSAIDSPVRLSQVIDYTNQVSNFNLLGAAAYNERVAKAVHTLQEAVIDLATSVAVTAAVSNRIVELLKDKFGEESLDFKAENEEEILAAGGIDYTDHIVKN